MRRRAFLIGLGSTIIAGAARGIRAATALGPAWHVVPAITVWSAPQDPRLSLVDDAAAFWNRTFREIGSGFHLGAVSAGAGTVPIGALSAQSGLALSGGRAIDMPDWLRGHAGEMVIVLSDDDFVSFTRRWMSAPTVLIGIKSGRSYPLTLPNATRNVIAHEMGHALGLAHNSNPALLMCGRPSPCRPDAFQSATEHYFPLSDDEKALLLRLYPPDWRAG